MNKGKIIKNISNTYSVILEDNSVYDCIPRGKFRYQELTPLVGDYCLIDIENNYITELLPRTNTLTRPDVCNVDIGLIVSSVKKPDLDLLLLDKLIINILKENIEPVICFTKLDLLEENELKEVETLIKYYNEIGIKSFSNTELEEIKTYLKGKEVVLTGQTGAGKSSLINKLGDLNLKTNPISEALGRGIHTTRHTEIFKVADFYLVDTPGFSSVDLSNVNPEIIRTNFMEFNNYSCPFRDCAHLKETKCRVKDAVESGEILKSRYENYQKIMSENTYKSY